MTMKDTSIKISEDDLKPQREDALELFYSGIRSAETRKTMDRNLKRFLVEACSEVLEGSYKDRAQQFVNIARTDQKLAFRIVFAYAKYLRKRTGYAQDHPLYLNPCHRAIP